MFSKGSGPMALVDLTHKGSYSRVRDIPSDVLFCAYSALTRAFGIAVTTRATVQGGYSYACPQL